MAKSKTEQKTEKPIWLKYTEEEVKAIIHKLSNQGLTAEKIGLYLRDQYGIPTIKLYGIKIKDVLEEKGKYQEPNIINLEAKIQKIIEHYKKNKQDKNAERSLIISKAKLKKRKEYMERKEK